MESRAERGMLEAVSALGEAKSRKAGVAQPAHTIARSSNSSVVQATGSGPTPFSVLVILTSRRLWRCRARSTGSLIRSVTKEIRCFQPGNISTGHYGSFGKLNENHKHVKHFWPIEVIFLSPYTNRRPCFSRFPCEEATQNGLILLLVELCGSVRSVKLFGRQIIPFSSMDERRQK